MSKNTKISLAIAMQFVMIGSIGSFVEWPFMNYVFIVSGVFFIATFFLFMRDAMHMDDL